MDEIDVCETFVSIQGESSYAGFPCFFIRLSGCNLRCGYCDTVYAYEAGRKVSVEELVKECAESSMRLVEITGGEPLLQDGFSALAEALGNLSGRKVIVETNGSQDISKIPDGVISIMDIKCPGSGEADAMDWGNIDKLSPIDEVKFVLSDRDDYEWSRDVVQKYSLNEICNAVFFSPVMSESGEELIADLGKWIVDDRLDVRLQVQLHKVFGMK